MRALTANELLAHEDEAPIGAGLTPRSLRRTFASLLDALGHDRVYVMQQMGHTDPKLGAAYLRPSNAPPRR